MAGLDCPARRWCLAGPLAYWVDWMEAQRRQGAMWQGRLEALLARHWPEATRWLKLSSLTLMSILEHYGGPEGLANDQQAAVRMASWGHQYLSAEKIRGVLASARETVGVRQGEMDLRRMRQYAAQALAARREMAQSKRRLADDRQDAETIDGSSQSFAGYVDVQRQHLCLLKQISHGDF